MVRLTLIWLTLALLLGLSIGTGGHVRDVLAARAPATPFVRPEFAARLDALRPAIVAAAARHNHPALSGMSDQEFAEVLVLILYNEHFGWLEDALPSLRPLTPLYQQAQATLNARGADLTVWPSNLRPSVALEIRRGELPLRGGRVIRVSLPVAGSRVDLDSYPSRAALYAALNAELTQPELAVEYLAANLARGVYRARIEGVPVTWRALAAWHNQGIVAPAEIAANPTARDYLRRAAGYRAAARAFVSGGTAYSRTAQ